MDQSASANEGSGTLEACTVQGSFLALLARGLKTNVDAAWETPSAMTDGVYMSLRLLWSMVHSSSSMWKMLATGTLMLLIGQGMTDTGAVEDCDMDRT